MAAISQLSGDPQETLEWLDVARGLAEANSDRRGLIRAVVSRITALVHAGQIPEAESLLSSLPFAEEVVPIDVKTDLAHVRATVALARDDPEEALRQVALGIGNAERYGAGRARALGPLHQTAASILRELRRYEESAQHANYALELSSRYSGASVDRITVLIVSASTHLEAGRMSEASAAIDEAADQIDQLGLSGSAVEAQVAAARGRYEFVTGQYVRSAETLRSATSALRGSGGSYLVMLAEALYHLAYSESVLGNGERAVAAALEARQTDISLYGETSLEIAKDDLVLVRAYLSCGELEKARMTLTRASNLFGESIDAVDPWRQEVVELLELVDLYSVEVVSRVPVGSPRSPMVLVLNWNRRHISIGRKIRGLSLERSVEQAKGWAEAACAAEGARLTTWVGSNSPDTWWSMDPLSGTGVHLRRCSDEWKLITPYASMEGSGPVLERDARLWARDILRHEGLTAGGWRKRRESQTPGSETRYTVVVIRDFGVGSQ